jgi:hypothetical protein
MKKNPKTPTADKFPRKSIECKAGPSNDEKGRAWADMINSPELAAFRVIGMMQPKHLADGIDAPSMLDALRDQAAKVQGGDLTHAEAMLINQASALQALFTRLSERAMEQTHLTNLEGFMRMALRAQSQCRATVETLVTIKNPPVVYARQANVTTGPQQVNNGILSPTRAREIEAKQTQLSEGTHELLPNARASGIAIRVNPALETLGRVDWTEIVRR